MPKVIWLKPTLGPYDKTVQRIEAVLISVGDEWCTVGVNGKRFSAKTADVKMVKTASA